MKTIQTFDADLGLKRDVEFGKRSGCKAPASKLAYKWPLALDMIRSGFKAGREKKLLAFFTKHFNELSPTAEVSILGGIGYVTQDPENIEALVVAFVELSSLIVDYF